MRPKKFDKRVRELAEKFRFNGYKEKSKKQDVMIPVGFEPESKRFYPFEQDELRFKKYSWGGNEN